MAGSLNKVQLIGRLGNDPEIRATQDGKSICSFSVATSETWRDKNTNERKERTEWHKVVIFNENLSKIAEQYVKKGSQIYIEGQLQTRKWQDASGIDKYSTEIVLKQYRGELVLLDKLEQRNTLNNANQESDNNDKPLEGFTGKSTELDDDIPF